MKVVYNLGLGDAIICAPIIAKLAQENKTVEIPCWEHNLISVQSFFTNYDNIKIFPFKTESMMLLWAENADLRLGYYGEGKQRHDEDFKEWFYRQADFDIIQKDIYCPIQKASEALDPTKATYSNDFIFVHDDRKRGFVIDKIGMRPYNDTDNSILTKVKTLTNAKELHCIDSAFLHLIEAIEIKGKLFYHKYARPGSENYKSFTKNWTVIY